MKSIVSICGASLCFVLGCAGAPQQADVESNVAVQSDRLEATNYCATSLAAVAASATVGAGGAITFGTTQGFNYRPGAGGAVDGGPGNPYLFAVAGSSEGGEGLMTVRGPQGSAGTAYFCTYNVGPNGKLALVGQQAGSLIAGTQVTKAVGPGQILLAVDEIPVRNYRVFASMVDFVGSCTIEKTWAANKLTAGATSITVNTGYVGGLAPNPGLAFDEYYSYLSSTYQYDAADPAKDDTLVAAELSSGGPRGRFLACEFAKRTGAGDWSTVTASDLVLAARYPANFDSVDSGGADIITWLSATTPAGAGSDRVMLVSLAQHWLFPAMYTARVSLTR